MTTIAYRAGILAADSQGTDDDHGGRTKTTKIFKIRDCIAAFAGDVAEGHVFMKWLRKGKPEDEKPTFDKDEFEGVTLDANGLWFWDWNFIPVPLEDEFCAIGSGAAFAIGAMEAGASAIEAVEIAIRRDTGSGGKIVSYAVADLV